MNPRRMSEGRPPVGRILWKSWRGRLCGSASGPMGS